MYFYFSKILAPFLNFTNILILIIFLSFFFKKRLFKKNIKFIINFSIFLILLISFLPVGNFGLRFLEKNYLVQENFKLLENIIVLSGSENINNTLLTKKTNLNDSSERLIASVKLAIKYPNSNIYFLGGDGNLVKSNLNEIDVAKKFYEDLDFDIKRIKFIDKTRNTIENLKKLKNFIKDDEVNILITSAFHMKRTIIIAKKLNIKFIPYAVDFRSFNSSSIINYYQTFRISENLRSFDIFFRELLGILAVKLFY